MRSIENLYATGLSGMMWLAFAVASQGGANVEHPAIDSVEPPGSSVGTVAETMDAGKYTYVRVETGKEEFWAAAPRFAVQVGDQVSVPEGMPMVNFTSPTLNRTFDVVRFVSRVRVEGAGEPHAALGGRPGLPVGHPPLGEMKEPRHANPFMPVVDEGADLTIADVYDRRADLAGTAVGVRGVVVKINPRIMGKNWVHLEDQSGELDLTVTTMDEAQLGDTIYAQGVLATNRDFGYNYQFDVILEDAKISTESSARR